MRRPPIVRFLGLVEVPPPTSNDCWLWKGSRQVSGYGVWRSGLEGTVGSPAHRASYEFFVGPIPEGLQIDHLCRVRNCVNPDHLEPVTPKENIRRGRRANAEKTHCKWGHPFTPENTYVRKARPDWRECRTCNELRSWQRALRRRAA